MERKSPGFEFVTATAYVEALRADLAQFENSEGFVMDLISRYKDPIMVNTLVNFASWVEPINEDSSFNDDCLASTAFLQGELVGLRVAEEYIGQAFLRRLVSETRFSVPDVDESDIRYIYDCWQARARVVDRAGAHGYDLSEPYHAWLATVGSDLNSCTQEPQAFLHGFGIIMLLADQIVAADEIKSLTQLTAGDTSLNWDEAFERELP